MRPDSDTNQLSDIDEDTLQRIEDRVLREEKEQLSYQLPHNIIPTIKQIVEEEVPETGEDQRTHQE